MSLEFFSAPIFKFKVSMDSSHQARLNGVVLKIDQAVLEILTAPPIFKFKVSMDSSHQA